METAVIEKDEASSCNPVDPLNEISFKAEVNICQLCGDRGFSDALIDCEKCNAYSIHRYCLHVLPKTFDEYVTWFCDDCEKIKPTLDKSKVLILGESIPEVQAKKQLEKKIKKKAKKKFKKKVKGDKGKRKMEMYQEDRAISVKHTSDFVSHGQSSAQPLVDPVGSLRVRDKKAMKNGKKRVEDDKGGPPHPPSLVERRITRSWTKRTSKN